MLTKREFVCLTHFGVVILLVKITGFNLEWYSAEITSITTFLLVSMLTLQFTKNLLLSEKVKASNKSVLITGCDSGFGHGLAKRLDSKGFHVFASCLFPNGDGAEALKKNCSKRLKIFELDVSKDESVKSAASFVKDNLGNTKLWAIVNNAGIQKGFSIEFSTMEDFKDTLNVNSLGLVRVTKAFLPLLRESRGRVVNVTSIYGRAVTPHVTPYVMSKWAAAAFNNCLRQEMAVWGISVVSVEPEIFRTHICDKDLVEKRWETTLNGLDNDVKAEYGEDFVKTLKRASRIFMKLFSPNVNLVINDMESAVTLKYPDPAYKPRRNFLVRFVLFLFVSIPETLQDVIIQFVLVYGGNFPSSLRKTHKRE